MHFSRISSLAMPPPPKVTLKPAARICTNTHRPGDRFTATLASAVQGSNGVEIPAGAVAVLRHVVTDIGTLDDKNYNEYSYKGAEDGATAVEYGLIVALIAAVIVGISGFLKVRPTPAPKVSHTTEV